MKNKNIKKSFIGYCVFYFSIYAILVLLLFVLINGIVNKKMDRYIPNIDYLFEYEEYLKEDDFNKIPLKKFKRSDFVIFDQDLNIIFKTDNNPKITINSSDIEFINDYYRDSYFNIYEFDDKEEEKYLVLKTTLDSDSSFEKADDYAILNKDLNVLEGNVFGGKDSLTKREFNLIKGVNGSSNYVEKYNYETNDGKSRTLIFVEPMFNNKLYNKAIKSSMSNWLYLLAGIIVLIIIVTYLFYERINKFIKPVKNAIDNYEYDTLEVLDNKDIPKEFDNLFDSFRELLLKLKKEEEKSKNIYKEKQRIITNLSHDLKTPLTVISGYAKAFQDGVIPKDQKKKYIDAIYNKSIDASNIINTLFVYAQIEHPEYQMQIEEVNFTSFCQEYLSKKKTELELNGYKLETNIPSNEILLSIDKNLMIRLFENIINNSVKYNKEGTKIYFKLELHNKKVKLIIADNGVGISSDLGNDLFKPFVVGDEARSNNTGTGLGLSIAKKIVDMHDGNIKLVSKPKKPYKFQIEIILNVK